MMRALVALIALAALAAACTSPEATRQRAGGAGADVGNRGGIELHAGAQPYAKTPVVVPQARGATEVSASPRGR